MNRKALAVIAILIVIISFGIGYMKGASDAIEKAIDLGSEFLDIELTPRAKQILISNPALVHQILETAGGTYNGTNPFINHPQASVHFEYCMLTTGDYDRCYLAGITKYGEYANDRGQEIGLKSS